MSASRIKISLQNIVLELLAKTQRAYNQIQCLNIQAINGFRISHLDLRQPKGVRPAVGTGAVQVIVCCSDCVGRTGSFILLKVMTEVLQALYVSARPSH
ncbi:hypothetical protein PtB15_5B780 [Puccinia triticina]|nr:hypothetical protein PtB15_5B780 [Puccinia triticina]